METGVGMSKNNHKTTISAEEQKRRTDLIKKYSWKPGQSGNPKGRPKKFESQFDQCSREIQEKIRERLHQALSCADKNEALAILDVNDGSLGEYGFVLQIAARDLIGKGGMGSLQQIYEMLYGRLPQTNVNVDIDDDKKDAFIKGVFIP